MCQGIAVLISVLFLGVLSVLLALTIRHYIKLTLVDPTPVGRSELLGYRMASRNQSPSPPPLNSVSKVVAMRHEFNERLAFFAALCSSFLHHVYQTRIIFFSLVRYGFYNSNYTAHTSTFIHINLSACPCDCQHLCTILSRFWLAQSWRQRISDMGIET